MPWHLFLALKQLFPTGRRLGSFFFAASVLGVALGVMVLVIVQSVMGGFGAVHRERIVETSGHLDIRESGRPFANYEGIVERLEQEQGVTSISPYAMGPVMVRARGQQSYPLVYGLDLTRSGGMDLEAFLQFGNLENLGDESALLSRSTAARLGVFIGDAIEIYSPIMIEKAMGSDEILLPRELEVVGVYDIEWNDRFSPGVVTSLRTMQDLYDMDGMVNGIMVRVADNTDEFALADALNAEIGPWRQALTWREVWKDFLWVLDLEKTMMLFLNLFIVAVAVFAIAIAQLLTVVRKTREIGLLGAIGASPRGVWTMYLFQGLLIGVAGTALGILLAVTALSFRDPIIDWISTISGTRDTLVRFYYFSHLPVKYAARDFVIIITSALLLSTAAGVLPAIRAARLKPADALRSNG